MIDQNSTFMVLFFYSVDTVGKLKLRLEFFLTLAMNTSRSSGFKERDDEYRSHHSHGE